MKHIINEKPGSNEFREKFRVIRDDFISKLEDHIINLKIENYRQCDNDGMLDKYPFETLEDAKQFMEFMIDQGFEFAFIGTKTEQGIEVWLTRWEEPYEAPNWPKNTVPLFEEIHEGVYSE